MGQGGPLGGSGPQAQPQLSLFAAWKAWLGDPGTSDPNLAQRLLGRLRKPARPVSVSSLPSLTPNPQGHLEMSFLQLSGAEVTLAQQITLKVEQCPPARQGQCWGQWARGHPQAAWARSGIGVGRGMGLERGRCCLEGLRPTFKSRTDSGSFPHPLNRVSITFSWQGEKVNPGCRPTLNAQ